MGYSNSVYKAASDTLHERRLNAEKAAERRKEEVYKKWVHLSGWASSGCIPVYLLAEG